MATTQINYTLDHDLEEVRELAGLQPDIKRSLSGLLEVVSFRPGQRLQRAGEPFKGLFIVASGQVRLVLENGQSGQTVVDTLHEGAYFGIEGLFSEEAAPLSAFAAQPDTTLLALSRERLHGYFNDNPEVETSFRAYASERIALDVLATSPLFRHLPRERAKALVHALKRRHLDAGQELIREGDVGEEVYVVEAGRLRVYRENAPTVTLHIMHAGDVAGELALISGQRRAATVVAETDATVLALNRTDFLKLLEEEEALGQSFDLMASERRTALGEISGDGSVGEAPSIVEPAQDQLAPPVEKVEEAPADVDAAGRSVQKRRAR